ncbi:MAG: DNA processing protein DprA, partial [Alistipes sp.]
SAVLPTLTADEAGVLGCFRTSDPVSTEELVVLSALTVGDLWVLLLGLEMAGAVRQLPGNRYMKMVQ